MGLFTLLDVFSVQNMLLFDMMEECNFEILLWVLRLLSCAHDLCLMIWARGRQTCEHCSLHVYFKLCVVNVCFMLIFKWIVWGVVVGASVAVFKWRGLMILFHVNPSPLAMFLCKSQPCHNKRTGYCRHSDIVIWAELTSKGSGWIRMVPVGDVEVQPSMEVVRSHFVDSKVCDHIALVRGFSQWRSGAHFCIAWACVTSGSDISSE